MAGRWIVNMRRIFIYLLIQNLIWQNVYKYFSLKHRLRGETERGRGEGNIANSCLLLTRRMWCESFMWWDNKGEAHKLWVSMPDNCLHHVTDNRHKSPDAMLSCFRHRNVIFCTARPSKYEKWTILKRSQISYQFLEKCRETVSRSYLNFNLRVSRLIRL